MSAVKINLAYFKVCTCREEQAGPITGLILVPCNRAQENQCYLLLLALVLLADLPAKLRYKMLQSELAEKDRNTE